MGSEGNGERRTGALRAEQSEVADRRGLAAAVTVVVSTLDRPVLLERCIQAILAGTRHPRAIVVIDQGRAGAPTEVYAEATRRGIELTHIKQPRRGLAASQNTGVATARTDVVAIVDDDCIPDAHWIEVIEAAMASSSGPLLLTGRVLPLPPHGDRIAAVSTRDSTLRYEWTRPPFPWEIGTGGNFAVARRAFLDVGGNDDRLGSGSPGRAGNDLDLFHRLVVAGVRARYEPDLVVHHERSTVAEYTSRRGSYGFGLGAMIGLWFRRGDTHAFPTLVGWLRLRSRLAYQRRHNGGLPQEARVLGGTVAGLCYGLRMRRRAAGAGGR